MGKIIFIIHIFSKIPKSTYITRISVLFLNENKCIFETFCPFFALFFLALIIAFYRV
nr:MAG TPA: hypothetical protein [Caudoviricetes sp.]